MESIQSTKNHATVFQSDPRTPYLLISLGAYFKTVSPGPKNQKWYLEIVLLHEQSLGSWLPSSGILCHSWVPILGRVCSSVKARLWRGYCPCYTSFPSGSHGGNHKHKCHIGKCFYPVVYQSPYFFPPAFKSEQSNFKTYSSQLKCIAAFLLLSEDI